jgi:phosphopantothenoylcysteine decarboxylase/phosphopantothenate--cysteine ligase
LLKKKNILLVISGSVAAEKCLGLIKKFKQSGANVDCIVTANAKKFISTSTIRKITGKKVFIELFNRKDSRDMSHIDLSRCADVLLVAPASANLIAKMAHGLADDLATTTLLASNKKIILAPAMNLYMWKNVLTQRNIKILKESGIKIINPTSGKLACGEMGEGRMEEVENIFKSVHDFLARSNALKNISAIVTSGPTIEPIDPIRYISNRSSGKQGHAIAQSLANLGAHTTLISGPTDLPDPEGVNTIHVETALQMYNQCKKKLPVDIAICNAAVSDWRLQKTSKLKIKKEIVRKKSGSLIFKLKENPDILHYLSNAKNLRPRLVIGFAAETNNLPHNAKEKLIKKNCDWVLANKINKKTNIIGGENNLIRFVDKNQSEAWPKMTKIAVAEKLADKIDHYFNK